MTISHANATIIAFAWQTNFLYGTPGSDETAAAVAEAARQSTIVFIETADAYCKVVLAGLPAQGSPQPGEQGRQAPQGRKAESKMRTVSVWHPIYSAHIGIGIPHMREAKRFEVDFCGCLARIAA